MPHYEDIVSPTNIMTVAMAILNHNIFDNVRTRVIVVSEGHILLLPPGSPDAGWLLPGGGMERDESLVECAQREVLEETGISVIAERIAFLREWVVPKYARPLIDDFVESKYGQAGAGEEAFGFGLEVYVYARTDEPIPTPVAESPGLALPTWVPLADVPGLPVWPKELKWLCRRLAAGRSVAAVPSFVSDLDSPWSDSETDPFA
jgi:8-oxo-dGTP pyrophosphatase MutT (NUDIX family)